jgi:Tol biopolymer transport system component/DNA-binding winged helix-turn-helix (wHTH) protein
MEEPSAVATRVRFGAFTLDVRTGELWKGPTRLKVPDQSIEILKTLVERPGELVTRDELRERLWPSNHFVDFEHGLNAAMRRLREALGDSADAPTFIETLPKRGYRFIGLAKLDGGIATGGGRAVATVARAAESDGTVLDPAQTSGDTVPLPATVAPSSTGGPGLASRRSIVILALAAATTAAGVLAVWWWRTPRTAPSTPATALTRLTFDPGLQMNPTISPDGAFIAYASNKSGNFDIWIQSTTPGGEPRSVTSHPAHDWQPTWSPDGTQIVFRSERDGGGLFLMPTTGGREKKICDFGYEPRWSPDGTRVLFSELALRGAGRGEVYTLGTDGWRPVAVDLSALSPDERINPSVGWHPDARRVTFFNVRVAPGRRILQVVTIDVQQGTATRSNVDQHVNDTFHQYRLLNARGGQPLVWAPDGRALYFIGDYFGVESIWMVDVDPRTFAVTGGPHRVTGTSEDNEGLSLSRDGRRLVFGAANRKARVALYRLDPSGGQIVGAPEFMTGEEVHARAPDLTPDGSRLVFGLFRPSSGARRTDLRERPIAGSSPRAAPARKRWDRWRGANCSSMVT